ncbi:MAG: DNA polymerase III subunit gamma/tau [Chroococcidiopsidaceae cyanobacterium CP_BM_RX_35]|nr:DNA polymerase III subunit gamma/tau [Chroococcidiopsidaceae cyanobacterium CP_BM_RX_35]
MSYEPLHHKYRPKNLAELVGQSVIATTLTNAIRTEKIAPAYLFTGPRGTGKTSSARILAKSLNCLSNNKPTEQPCGACEACQGIARGSALDVIEIDAASNTGVDNIREIIERAQFAPVQCRYKVYVIDECHMLSTAAFNSLLKTLEEPPDRVVFVLATTDPQRVLPTIISRCQRFDFRRIPLEAMVTHLSVIADLENINTTSEAVRLVAQVSQGGLRDAESLLDQLSLLSGQVTVERVWDLVGSCSEPNLVELLQAIAQNHPEAVLDCARRIMDRGREPLTILQNLAGFYRDLLIAKTSPNRHDLVAVTPPTWKALCDLSLLWDIPTILSGQKHLKDSEVQVKQTTQPRLWLEVTLLGLLPVANSTQRLVASAQPPVSQSDEGVQQQSVDASSSPTEPQRLIPDSIPWSHQALEADQAASVQDAQPPVPPRENLQPTIAEEAHNSPQMAEPVGDVERNPSTHTTSEISQEQIWQQMLVQLEPESTKQMLRQLGHLIEFDGAVARVSLPQKWQEKLANIREKIELAFQKTLNRRVRVLLVAGASTQPKTTSSNELQGRSPQLPVLPSPGTDATSAPQGNACGSSDTVNKGEAFSVASEGNLQENDGMREPRPNRTDALREGCGDGEPVPYKSRVDRIDPNVLLNSRVQAQAKQVKSHQPLSASQAETCDSQFQTAMFASIQPLQSPEIEISESLARDADHIPHRTTTDLEEDVMNSAQQLAKAFSGELIELKGSLEATPATQISALNSSSGALPPAQERKLNIESTFPNIGTNSPLSPAISVTSWAEGEDEEEIEF